MDTLITEGEQEYRLAMNPKTFSTGSVGYFANGRAEFNGKKYQVQVQMVEIGSKPKQEEGEK